MYSTERVLSLARGVLAPILELPQQTGGAGKRGPHCALFAQWGACKRQDPFAATDVLN